MVGLTSYMSFGPDEVIKFNKIITNVAGGYIDDNNSTDYGKFIAPQNGTYQFSANFFNANELIGADLAKNGAWVIGGRNMNGDPGSLNAIFDLEEGHEVYLVVPGWAPDARLYSRYFTSFSGVLVRATVSTMFNQIYDNDKRKFNNNIKTASFWSQSKLVNYFDLITKLCDYGIAKH